MKTEIVQDERKGWTSASNAEADSLCQGRHQAQCGLPDETPTEDAESGNRIHAYLAGEPIHLTSDELETADKCREIEAELMSRVFGDVTPQVIREFRFWTEIEDGHQRLMHSGKPDVVAIVGTSALIIDYKTGRNEVAESSRNMQLRDLAALMHSQAKPIVKTVYVAVIQPWVTTTPEITLYAVFDLVRALADMENRVVASNMPNAKRTPGEIQCRYCKAKAFCPEARESALTAIPRLPIANATPKDVATALSGEQLSAFLNHAAFAEDVIDACKAEAKKRLQSGERVPGYAIQAGAVRETITNAEACWQRVSAKGVTLPNFMAAVSVGKGKLKDAIRAATGAKGKALDNEMGTVLAGITEEKQCAPSLVKSNV